MVAPIFNARSEIKKAQTSDEAYKLAIDFLYSEEAVDTKMDQAGTFLTDMKSLFLEQHKTPSQYSFLLDEIISGRSNASYALQELATKRKEELNQTKQFVRDSMIGSGFISRALKNGA